MNTAAAAGVGVVLGMSTGQAFAQPPGYETVSQSFTAPSGQLPSAAEVSCIGDFETVLGGGVAETSSTSTEVSVQGSWPINSTTSLQS